MNPRSPFEILALDESQRLDLETLKARYDELRVKLHPDRFVNASATELRIAEQMTADLNEAYQLLKDPLRRAAWLLAKQGCDPFDERIKNAMPVDFLERQMELREELEDLDSDTKKTSKFVSDLQTEIDEEFNNLAVIIDDKKEELEKAVQGAQRLRYLINCQLEAKRIFKGK